MGIRDLGDAEVGHLHASVLTYQDVSRLDVAMDQPLPVRMPECLQHRKGDGHGFIGRQLAPFLEDVSQRASGEVFHDDVAGTVVVARVEDADDAGVAEPRGRYGLSLETFGEGGVVRELWSQDLHGDHPGQYLVPGSPHLGHAPGCDELLEHVAAGEPAIGRHRLHAGSVPIRTLCLRGFESFLAVGGHLRCVLFEESDPSDPESAGQLLHADGDGPVAGDVHRGDGGVRVDRGRGGLGISLDPIWLVGSEPCVGTGRGGGPGHALGPDLSGDDLAAIVHGEGEDRHSQCGLEDQPPDVAALAGKV